MVNFLCKLKQHSLKTRGDQDLAEQDRTEKIYLQANVVLARFEKAMQCLFDIVDVEQNLQEIGPGGLCLTIEIGWNDARGTFNIA